MDEQQLTELDQLEACRICVQCFPIESMDFIYIFNKNEEFQSELDFIQDFIEFIKLGIQPNDGLPQRICANCFSKFVSVDAFRRECVDAQQSLRNLTKSVQVQHDDTPSSSSSISTSKPMLATYSNGQEDMLASGTTGQTEITLNDLYNQELQLTNSVLMDSANTSSANNATNLCIQNYPELQIYENTPTAAAITSSTSNLLPNATETDATFVNANCTTSSIFNGAMLTSKEQNCSDNNSIRTQVQQDQQCSKRNQTVAGNSIALNHQKPTNPVLKTDNSSCTMNMEQFAFENANNDADHNDSLDDSEINKRLLNETFACHYCYCPLPPADVQHLVFANENALSKHFFEEHEPNRPYTCPQCPQAFEIQSERNKHTRDVHKLDAVCEFCQIIVKGDMQSHEYNCQYVGNWECQECKLKFVKVPRSRFRLHQRVHVRSNINFQCHICDRGFMKKTNLEAHYKTHTSQSNIVYPCSDCNEKFVDEYHLKRHQYQKHNGPLPAQCEFCSKGFVALAYLQRHVKQHHSAEDANKNSEQSSKTNLCSNCSMNFPTALQLEEHLKQERQPDGKCSIIDYRRRSGVYPCFQCPRRFNLRSQLDKHLSSHESKKQRMSKSSLAKKSTCNSETGFCCNEEDCKFVCKSEKLLNKHINITHSLETCEYCRKQFSSQQLAEHIKLKHPNEYNFYATLESPNKTEQIFNNNNNDITQISLNLLQQTPTKSIATSVAAAISNPGFISLSPTTKSALLNAKYTLTSSPDTSSVPSSSLATSSMSSASSTCSTLNEQLSVMFVGDHHHHHTDLAANSPQPSAASVDHCIGAGGEGNGSSNDLNVLNEVNSDLFLMPSGNAAASNEDVNHSNSNNIDQYFMASLLDTEQEIVVT